MGTKNPEIPKDPEPAEAPEDVITRLGKVAEERSLTDEEVATFEVAEKAILERQKQEDFKRRHAAMMAIINQVQPGLNVGSATSKNSEEVLCRAFDSYVRTGFPNADMIQLRAQGEDIGSAGGYLVPTGYLSRITETMLAFGGIAGVAETITTSTGNPLPWLTNDDTSNEGGIVAEGAAPSSGADLVFGQRALGAYKYSSAGASGSPLRVSVELLQDSEIDIRAFIGRKLGQRLARAMAAHLVTGSGVAEPLGLVTGLTGLEMTTGGPTYNDLIDAVHGVDTAYREMGNCRFAFNDTTLKAIRKLTDSNGDPLWKGVADNMGSALGGSSLMGYPVTIDNAFGDVVDGGGADDNWGVFGDIRQGYVIRRVQGVTLFVDPYTRGSYGQVEFQAWMRADGTQNDTSAYTALAGYTA